MRIRAACPAQGLAVAAILFAALAGGMAAADSAPPAALTDDQIRSLLIRQSIAGYPGSCPCPYNLAKNGSKCGRRSAYSRPGGYSPLCYPDDVTPDMIARFRADQKSR